MLDIHDSEVQDEEDDEFIGLQSVKGTQPQDPREGPKFTREELSSIHAVRD